MSFDAFLVYTTHQGGRMYVRWSSADEYERVRKSGRITTEDGATVPVKMVAFATLDELTDLASPARGR